MSLQLLSFLREGALLSFRGPASDEWRLIPDLPTAKSRAWDQSEDFPCWTDLRESVVSKSGAWRLRTEGLSQQVQELVFAYTPLALAELENDIAADLTHCVAYQSSGGRDERLFPMTLAAYTAGGWPCGWFGEYPAGQLCVYWPPEPLPAVEAHTSHDRRVAFQKQRTRERIERGSAGGCGSR